MVLGHLPDHLLNLISSSDMHIIWHGSIVYMLNFKHCLGHTKLISYFWCACGSIFSELLDLRNQM